MNHTRKLFVILVFSFTATAVKAQLTSVDSVKVAIGIFFNTIRRSDGKAFQACFLDSAQYRTPNRDRSGGLIIRFENLKEFGKRIDSIPKGIADPQISFDVVKVDGAVAFAWVPYKFFINGKISHCGVSIFEMLRVIDRWKIYSLMETRRTNSCLN